jgi:hypothetical protein
VSPPPIIINGTVPVPVILAPNPTVQVAYPQVFPQPTPVITVPTWNTGIAPSPYPNQPHYPSNNKPTYPHNNKF